MANLLDENEVNPYILAPGMIAAGTGDPENEVATPRRGVFAKDQSAYTPPGDKKDKDQSAAPGDKQAIHDFLARDDEEFSDDDHDLEFAAISGGNHPNESDHPTGMREDSEVGKMKRFLEYSDEEGDSDSELPSATVNGDAVIPEICAPQADATPMASAHSSDESSVLPNPTGGVEIDTRKKRNLTEEIENFLNSSDDEETRSLVFESSDRLPFE